MHRQKIILFGSFDIGKPRVRIMRDALHKSQHFDVIEIARNPWQGVEDKSQLRFGQRIQHIWRIAVAYPRLITNYMRAPRRSTVVIGYMGILDVIILWPFAKIRRARIVWDMFLSAYDTTIHDRQLLSAWHPLAWALYAAEWMACKMADIVVLDTEAHANYIARIFHIPKNKITFIAVGAEEKYFFPALHNQKNTPFHVLFYGQCIPLHGMETILQAIERNQHHPQRDMLRWTLIGSGQEANKLKAQFATQSFTNCTWLPWVEYSKLHRYIHDADICLGIFGASEKAAQVIPNKVYQALACGKPVITRSSPAMATVSLPHITTIAAQDADALLAALYDAMEAPSCEVTPYQPIRQIEAEWQKLAAGQTSV
ncbi:MAG: glycosyltransferase [Alphaproteobacteria bacterium]|nr:glycosyltransferase [Alphaproteobacteria bacterium]